MLELFLPVPFHAFFGVAIMMASSLVVDSFANPPAGWDVDPLGDQSVAGGIVWSFGELPTVLVLVVVFFSWMSSDERRGTDAGPGRRPQRRRRAQRLQRPPPGDGAQQVPLTTTARAPGRDARRGRLPASSPAWTTASSAGRSSLVALIRTAETSAAEHQQPRGPGEGRGVALDLRLEADGRVLRVAAAATAFAV